MVTVVVMSKDKRPIGSSERVGRSGALEAWHRWCGRSMGDSEPADGAYKIACSGSVDDGALREPIRGGTTGVDGGVQGRDVVGEFVTGDGDDENAEGVSAGKHRDDLQDAQQPW